MKEEELQDLKYRQLQKLAKDHGIKANLPKSSLIEELLKATSETETDNVEAEKTDHSPENRRGSKEDSVLTDTNRTSGGSRRESKRKSEVSDENEPKIEEMEIENVQIEETISKSGGGARRGSKRKSENNESSSLESKIPFDKSAVDAEVAKLEDMTNKLLDGPRQRSRNSSSMFRASSQVDTSNGSRRNSRLSNFFDKEAFDVEAAKVSKFAENILKNSPRRSSILNLTPSKSIRESPLVKTTETKKTVTTAKKVTLNTTGIPRPRKAPNFAKMHAKQFGKMDTLDTYLEKKEKRMAALTPGAKKAANQVKELQRPRRSPRDHPAKTVKASLNFGQPSTKKPFVSSQSSSKPFVFTAGNQTSTKQTFKPYTGKVQPLTKTNSLKTHQQMANRAMGGQNLKEKQMSVIKGVRMNKRMELMMQKRNLK